MSQRRWLTSAQKQEIVRLRAAGVMIVRIAEKMGVCSLTVRRVLQRHNNPIQPRERGWKTAIPDEVKAQIVPLHESGLRLFEISQRLGISAYTISHTLRKRYGHPLRRGKPSRFDEAVRQEIRQLYFKEGLAQVEIAKRFDIGQTTISRIVNAEYKARKAEAVRRG